MKFMGGDKVQIRHTSTKAIYAGEVMRVTNRTVQVMIGYPIFKATSFHVEHLTTVDGRFVIEVIDPTTQYGLLLTEAVQLQQIVGQYVTGFREHRYKEQIAVMTEAAVLREFVRALSQAVVAVHALAGPVFTD